MGTENDVVKALLADDDAGFCQAIEDLAQAIEDLAIEKLITQLAVKAFAIATQPRRNPFTSVRLDAAIVWWIL